MTESRLRRLTVASFVIGLTLFFAQAAAAQKIPSDSEMKEAVRLLLEREIPRPADGSTVTVLLDPNVRPGWIPEVPGFAIRKLSYAEQKQVPEYYELSWSLKGDGVVMSLARGNYCRKVGNRYEFRRKAGTWQPKLVAEIESSAVGGRCDGCVIGSGATYSVRRQISEPPAPAPRPDNLRLTGTVGKISCAKDGNSILCKTELHLTFTNTGSTSVIILQPQGEYAFWHGATSLALSEQESRANSLVYSVGGWPSVYRTPMYRTLANLLDQSAPPAGTTRVLPQNASWNWDTSITVGLQEGNTCNQHVGVEIGWDEIKRRTNPLWLRVSYEMWPFNVENFKPNLGSVLRKRWRSHGLLYLDEGENHSFTTLTSEPIEFPLQHVELPR